MATKPIENLTAPEQATFREEIGVNAENVLALLEDANIPANGWVLADTAGVALASGVIGWNNTLNTFVRHNGSTLGGVPILLSDPSIKRGSITASDFTAAKEVEIASFPLTALQAVVGKRFRITGTLQVLAFGANKPPNFYLGFTTRSNIADDLGGLGGFPDRLGILEGFAYSTASKDTWQFTFNEEIELTDAAPNFLLSFVSAFRKALVFNGTTLSADVKTNSDTVGISTDFGLIGSTDEEIVLVIQGEAGGGAVGSLFVSYDLKFEQTV